MAIVPLAIEYGYAMLDTLHERVGETFRAPMTPVYSDRVVKDARGKRAVVRSAPVPQADDGSRQWFAGGWARAIGEHGERKRNDFFRHGADYDYTLWGIQAGLDLFAREQTDGTLDKAGIYFGYGQLSADTWGRFPQITADMKLPADMWRGGKAGTVDIDAYTLGAYWTHHAASGWYTDAVVQGTWYDADARSIRGNGIKPSGFGIAASLEAGYAFKLGSGFTLEPQAQIVYQNVHFDSANNALGQMFRFEDGESLRGRIGVRLARTWNAGEEGKPRLVTAWLRANLWHEFLGNAKTEIAALNGTNRAAFATSLKGTWGEIGVGVSGQISENVSLFATGAYNRSLDNRGRQSWDGRLGLTVRW